MTKIKIPEKVISQDFNQRLVRFDEELTFLLNKYSLKLGVKIEPVNWLARALKKFIRITWRIVAADNLSEPQK